MEVKEIEFKVLYIDRGDTEEVPIAFTFLPFVSMRPWFYSVNEELKKHLLRCDISNIQPLATPCILSKSQRNQTSYICEKHEAEFVSFKVIGTENVETLTVNVISIQ